MLDPSNFRDVKRGVRQDSARVIAKKRHNAAIFLL